MKTKQFFFLIVLLNISCKVTQKNVVGFYQSDEVNQQALQINSDNTFFYEDHNFKKIFMTNEDIDSTHFCLKGNWTLVKNKLLLTSFGNSFSDTTRTGRILKTNTKSKTSNFSFKDTFGNTIPFNAIDDEKETFAAIVDKSYSDYDIDLTRHKKLIFYLGGYKPLYFKPDDTSPASYTITVFPFYKLGYFTNKILNVKRSRIFDGKTKYKRTNPAIDVSSIYVIHGPPNEL